MKHWLTNVLPVAVLSDTALSVGYKPHGRGCSSWFGQDFTKDERKEVRPALIHVLPDTLNPMHLLTPCTHMLRWRTSSLQRCNRGCQWRSWIRKAYRHLCMCGATTSYGRVSRCGACSARSHWIAPTAHGCRRSQTMALLLCVGQFRSLEMHATAGKPLHPSTSMRFGRTTQDHAMAKGRLAVSGCTKCQRVFTQNSRERCWRRHPLSEQVLDPPLAGLSGNARQ